MPKIKDISGQKFGRLTAIKSVGKDCHGISLWKCICKCGNETTVRLSSLTTGNTKSCGCLSREETKKRSTTHGLSGGQGNPTRLYRIWYAMKQRCNNPNDSGYEYYGERGIEICKEWREDYEKFYTWAKENDYQEDLTIDRINNNGNYKPNNCRWVTREEQMLNRRDNHYLTFQGKTQTITEWAEEVGIKRKTLNARINILDWSIEKALTSPTQGGNNEKLKID